MNIAAIGPPERIEELQSVVSLAGLEFTRLESTKNIQRGYDVIFDLDFDDNPGRIADYESLAGTMFFLSSVKIQLEAVVPRAMWKQVAGINAMRSFLGRKSLEYCMAEGELDVALINGLGWEEANKCASRVGLVSPRVVLMIINEAFYTLQEGTANKEDIDKGMKLGTAYPRGPFEWCGIIGIKDVYETLKVLYEDTCDERYRICNLLKTEYILSQN